MAEGDHVHLRVSVGGFPFVFVYHSVSTSLSNVLYCTVLFPFHITLGCVLFPLFALCVRHNSLGALTLALSSTVVVVSVAHCVVLHC